MELPPSRPAASNCPPDSCILFSSPPLCKNPKWQKAISGFWSKWRDSNSRHPAPKAGALPTALHLDVPIQITEKQARFLLRCPISSSAFKSLRQLSTAATRSAPLTPPLAAVALLPNCATPGYNILYLVRMYFKGFDAISQGEKGKGWAIYRKHQEKFYPHT